MSKKKTRGQLVSALRELQDLVGQIEGTYNNDRAPDRAGTILRLTGRAFNVALEALSTDPPQRASGRGKKWHRSACPAVSEARGVCTCRAT